MLMNPAETDLLPAATAPAAKPAASAAAAWSLVAVLFLLAIISVLDRNIVTLMIGPIKRHFLLSDVQISLLIGAAFALPFGALSIPVGWAVDRFERRAVIAVGIATWSVATIATGLARSFGALIAARSFVGAGDACLGPANTSMLSDMFPRDKLALPMSIASMGFKAGQGAALLIGALLTFAIAPEGRYTLPLFGAIQGWQLIFVAVGVPGLLFVPLIFLFREPARRSMGGHAGSIEGSFGDYFRFVFLNWRFFLPHHLGVLLLISMSYTVISWTPAFLMRAHGWSEATTGSWLGTAFLVAPLLGMPIHGAAADHLLRKGWTDIHMRYPMIAAGVGAPVAIAAFLVPSAPWAVVLAGIFMFIVSGYVSLPITALVSVMPSRLRGKAASIVALVSVTTGVVLGPLLVGTLTDIVFRDPAKVGYSIICCIAVLAPAMMATFGATLGPLRRMAASY